MKDASWLKHPAKYHKEWVQIVVNWGERDYAEDIVQEMYMRLLKSTTEKKIVTDGEVNKGYVWFALRSVFLGYIRQKNAVHKVSIDYKLKASDNEELNKLKALEKVYDAVDKEMKNWHWFDQLMFNIYRTTGHSMRRIAKESHISVDTIFDTLRACKQRIKEAVGEEYEDFKNKDYEHLKTEEWHRENEELKLRLKQTRLEQTNQSQKA